MCDCVQVLKPSHFEKRMAGHEIWQCTPLRAYYRAMYGVANTLRKMGRRDTLCGRLGCVVTHLSCLDVCAYSDQNRHH
jgi:hypothetical protein